MGTVMRTNRGWKVPVWDLSMSTQTAVGSKTSRSTVQPVEYIDLTRQGSKGYTYLCYAGINRWTQLFPFFKIILKTIFIHVGDCWKNGNKWHFKLSFCGINIGESTPDFGSGQSGFGFFVLRRRNRYIIRSKWIMGEWEIDSQSRPIWDGIQVWKAYVALSHIGLEWTFAPLYIQGTFYD